MGEGDLPRSTALSGKQEPAMPEAVYEKPKIDAGIYKGLKPGDEIPFPYGYDK